MVIDDADNVRMSQVESIVQEILRREDVEGLLILGAPADEYNSEAKGLALAIENNEIKPDAPELSRFLRVMWERSFGPIPEDELMKRDAAFQRIGRAIAVRLARP